MTALVTVITPTLTERAGMLAELADDLAGQTFTGWRWSIATDLDGRGPAAVRNELAAAATTEWLAFVDDDDRLDPDHLATLITWSVEADVVYTLCRVEGRDWLPDHDCHLKHLHEFNTIPVTSLVRRDLFLDAGGFPLGVRDEDWQLWRTLHALYARFVCVHHTTWTYRFHQVGRGNRTWAD